MNQPTTKNFSLITEAPGQKATEEQLSMLMTRYKLAIEYAQNKDVLELACGTGTGLGYISSVAKSVVGGDIDPSNIAIAQNTYQDRQSISVKELDVCNLPFPDKTFDTILFFEAIYYISDIQKCLSEIARVLKADGNLIIVTVNREWSGFNSSPFSEKYYNYQEATEILEQNNFSNKILVGYFDDRSSLPSKIIDTIRRTAVRLNLIPKTMGGKEFFKRIFYGSLRDIPVEIDETVGTAQPLKEIFSTAESVNYKVMYIISHKKAYSGG
jgi:ubiquinone/menaquinone biosynthesis C-methylase UbiE